LRPRSPQQRGGCGGKKSDTTATAGGKSGTRSASAPATGPTGPASPQATFKGGGGGCKLLSRDEAAKALGVPSVPPGIERQAKLGPVKAVLCYYYAGANHGPPLLFAGAFDLAGGGHALFQRYKAESCTSSEGCQDVSGVGDEAYFGGSSLAVRTGNREVIVGIASQSGDKAAELATDKVLAATMLSRL